MATTTVRPAILSTSPSRPTSSYSTRSTICAVTPSLSSLTEVLEKNCAITSTPRQESSEVPAIPIELIHKPFDDGNLDRNGSAGEDGGRNERPTSSIRSQPNPTHTPSNSRQVSRSPICMPFCRTGQGSPQKPWAWRTQMEEEIDNPKESYISLSSFPTPPSTSAKDYSPSAHEKPIVKGHRRSKEILSDLNGQAEQRISLLPVADENGSPRNRGLRVSGNDRMTASSLNSHQHPKASPDSFDIQPASPHPNAIDFTFPKRSHKNHGIGSEIGPFRSSNDRYSGRPDRYKFAPNLMRDKWLLNGEAKQGPFQNVKSVEELVRERRRVSSGGYGKKEKRQGQKKKQTKKDGKGMDDEVQRGNDEGCRCCMM